MLRKALETVLHKYLSDELAVRIIKEVLQELYELREQKEAADGESTNQTGSP